MGIGKRETLERKGRSFSSCGQPIECAVRQTPGHFELKAAKKKKEKKKLKQKTETGHSISTMHFAENYKIKDYQLVVMQSNAFFHCE